MGKRTDSYKLIAYVDSSSAIYGTVIYLYNECSKDISFLCAKNRIINSKFENKKTPSLELQALVFGTETLLSIYSEFTNDTVILPLKITELVLHSDSQCCLSWLKSYHAKFAKSNKYSVFVRNRLEMISKLCDQKSVKYKFCAGAENPADCITRCVSYKLLVKTSYHRGPQYMDGDDDLTIMVPNPLLESPVMVEANTVQIQKFDLIDINRFSSLRKTLKVYSNVIIFVEKLKSKIGKNSEVLSEADITSKASKLLIKQDQLKFYPDLLNYFNEGFKSHKTTPNLINQLNIYKDDEGILRVKHKLQQWRDHTDFPILLSKTSYLTQLIILDVHNRLNHSGLYCVIAKFRKQFYVPHIFSVVKSQLKKCVICQKFNGKPMALNQSPYRDFRIDPPNIPFRYVYCDYIGPINMKEGGKTTKVYLLLITCMWSRAVDLIICRSLNVSDFIRAIQIHSFKYGIFENCYSDLGSQIVPGGNLISDFLSDPETRKFFAAHGMQSVKFEQFPKGRKELGSMVEICVKLVKRLIFKSIGRNVLQARDFEFLVEQVIHLVNKRPIALKEAIRDNCILTEVPDAISPEILIFGRELLAPNIIPGLQDFETDPSFSLSGSDHIRTSHQKLAKARAVLVDIYNAEFAQNLLHQATNLPDRYKPKNNSDPKCGDLVLIKEPLLKCLNYPMGIIREVTKNSLGEVTEALVYKGSTKELIRRHVNSLIPVLVGQEPQINSSEVRQSNMDSDSSNHNSNRRPAAVNSELLTRAMLD